MTAKTLHDRISKKKLAEKIYYELESDIIDGTYPINTKLPPERELALKYNASRFVIREAITMLINANLAETKPQSGTYIKDFYNEPSLDSLIKILKASNSIDVDTFQSFVQYLTTSDVNNASRAAENITEDSLRNIEALMLKKKINTDPHILADCDYGIYYEIMKSSHDPINIAITVSMKPVRIMALRLLYTLPYYKELVLENDIQLFNALSAHDRVKASILMKERISIFENTVMKNARIENGKIHFNIPDDLLKR